MSADTLTHAVKEGSRVSTIESAGGLKFIANVRGHEVRTDQPVSGGGGDTAPTPLELVGVALGSCIALYITKFCEARNIATRGLRVEFAETTVKNPYRVGQYNVNVKLPDDFPEEYRAAVGRVIETCAVHNTLMHPPEILVQY